MGPIKTSKQLEWWYRYYNRKYFKATLPKIHVRFEKLESSVFGLTTFVGNPPVIVLSIDNSLKGFTNLSRQVLLHEMVHVSLPTSVMHGPKFEAGMRRLARLKAFTGLW